MNDCNNLERGARVRKPVARGNELSVDITHPAKVDEKERQTELIKKRWGGFQSGDHYRETKKEDKRRQEFPAAAPKPTVNQ